MDTGRPLGGVLLSAASLDEYLECAVEAALEAGGHVRSAWCCGPRDQERRLDDDDGAAAAGVFAKHGNELDLVTVTDRKCEELIARKLRERFPGSRFVGEETVSGGLKVELTDAPTWIVDPIDGTTNFVHGNPDCCVSIGLTVNKVPVVGVVYNPNREELYTAVKSKGAFLNRTQRLPITGRPVPAMLDTALVSTEWGADRRPKVLRSKLGSVSRMVAIPSEGGRHARGLRSTGSCVTNMCQVARGGIDLYWELGVHCWDMAAAIVIVRESGGTVVTCSGTWKCDRPCSSDVPLPADIDLLGRKLICVRAGDEPAKRSIIKEALAIIEDIEYERD